MSPDLAPPLWWALEDAVAALRRAGAEPAEIIARAGLDALEVRR